MNGIWSPKFPESMDSFMWEFDDIKIHWIWARYPALATGRYTLLILMNLTKSPKPFVILVMYSNWLQCSNVRRITARPQSSDVTDLNDWCLDSGLLLLCAGLPSRIQGRPGHFGVHLCSWSSTCYRTIDMRCMGMVGGLIAGMVGTFLNILIWSFGVGGNLEKSEFGQKIHKNRGIFCDVKIYFQQ